MSSNFSHRLDWFEDGVQVLTFDGEIFQGSFFIPEHEFRSTHILSVVNSTMNTLFYGDTKSVYKWLEVESNAEAAKMVAVGKDCQLISISEFRALFG